MKSVLKGIILALVTAIVVVVGGAYLISPVAQVERAIVIQAPPEHARRYSPEGVVDDFAEYHVRGIFRPGTAQPNPCGSQLSLGIVGPVLCEKLKPAGLGMRLRGRRH